MANELDDRVVQNSWVGAVHHKRSNPCLLRTPTSPALLSFLDTCLNCLLSMLCVPTINDL
jgi:hypothetical protein